MSPRTSDLAGSRPLRGHYTMSLYRKLLLSALLTGNDACVSLEQLYSMSLQQILGVPITYVTLTPILTGPLTIALMSVLGHFSDKGRRHRQRKVAVVVFNSLIILTGILILIAANVLMMRNLAAQKTNTTTLPDVFCGDLAEGNFTANPNFSLAPNTSFCQHSNRTAPGEEEDEDEEEVGLLSLSLTAVLALLGFGVMDTGYDLNLAATRSCILACSSPEEHTQLLVTALVMAGAGGCITTLLGSLDLSAVLDMGDQLVSQTTIQLVVCGVVLLLSLLSTAVTALLNIQHLDTPPYIHLVGEETAEETACCERAAEDKALYGTFNHGKDIAPGHSPDQKTENFHVSLHESQQLLLLPGETSAEGGSSGGGSRGEQHHHKNHSPPPSFPRNDHCSQPHTSGLVHKMAAGVADLDPTQAKRLRQQKVNFVIACITAYLGSSVTYLYNMYVADFLGKEVMGGDSSAPAGSAELMAYEDAVVVAAQGLLVFFCCYLSFSTVHSRLLAVWGLKWDLCLSHGVMAAAILSLTVSRTRAAYYACCVFYAFQRASLYSVPFVIAKDYAQQKVESGEGGRSQVGRALARVTCMIPLHFCTLFFLSGPLITLTHNDSTPLLMAAACTFLATVLFLFYRP